MTEQMAERVARRYPCCACCEGIALDDHVGHGGSIEKDGHDGPCESCERAAIAASLVAAAQAEIAERLLPIAANLLRASYDDDPERMAAALGNGSLAVKAVMDSLRIRPGAQAGEDRG